MNFKVMQKILLFLAELNNDDLNWIIQKGRKETLDPGKVLIQEGISIDALYIVLSGSLRVGLESLGDQELAIISSGEIVGEISFLDACPTLATVKALESSTILSVSRLHLNSKLQQDTEFASRFYHALSKSLAARLRGTVRRLSSGKNLEDPALEQNREDLSPSEQDRLQLSEIKFNWLKESAKLG